jgi:hypothetical protein
MPFKFDWLECLAFSPPRRKFLIMETLGSLKERGFKYLGICRMISRFEILRLATIAVLSPVSLDFAYLPDIQKVSNGVRLVIV